MCVNAEAAKEMLDEFERSLDAIDAQIGNLRAMWARVRDLADNAADAETGAGRHRKE